MSLSKILGLCGLLLLSSCVTSAQQPDRCLELEARYQAWGALGAAAAAVAGGGAVTTALPESVDQRLAIGLGSAGVMAIGAASVFVAQDILSAYSSECVDSSTTAEGF